MIERTVEFESGFRRRTLFLSRAETEEESQRLRNLASESLHYARESNGRTGLHVVLETERDGRAVLVVSLNSPLELTVEDRLRLEQECGKGAGHG